MKLMHNPVANNVMMCLGEFQFSADTAAYNTLQRTSSYRWKEQSRLHRPPAQQYQGVGNDTIRLTGVILPHYKGGLRQIDHMRVLASRGEPLSLVVVWLSSGDVMGKWCINSVEETQTHFSVSGAPLKIEFNLSLTAYGGDFEISDQRR